MKKRAYILIFLVIISCFIYLFFYGQQNVTQKNGYKSNDSKTEQIDNLIRKILKKSKIPGIAVAIIDNNQTEFITHGYADIENKKVVENETLFELGSMSKAYTALGILLLQNQGKLSLDDPISKYIPWFSVHFNGDYDGKKFDTDIDLKLSDLMNHTSGIPFETIGELPEGDSDDMLDKTVHMLNGIEIDFYPGSKYQYATLNYDILALVIQNITGQLYEDFMVENILKPLELNQSYFYTQNNAINDKLAKGHKISNFRTSAYDAPVYRGNTAAGYIISNIKDMERWMRIQLGLIQVPDQFKSIIIQSHIGNTRVMSTGEYYYAGGWEVHLSGKYIRHGGSNPNYSSMLVMNTDKKLGVCVLTNLNSNGSEYIAENIINILEGKKIDTYKNDTYKTLDTVFSCIKIVAALIVILYLVLIGITICGIIRKERVYQKLKKVKLAGVLLAIPLMVFCGFCIYYLPNILFERLPWKAVNVWGSSSIQEGCFWGYIAIVIFMIYVLLSFNFPRKNEKNYFALIPLSLINGLTSALIIFTINESFNRNLEYSRELVVYFIFALFYFVYTMKLLQGRIIVVANDYVYNKRMYMINKILDSNYETVEEIGKERIFSGLNNDTKAIFRLPEITINSASNLLTLIFCLVYLYTKNTYSFIASISVIVLNTAVSLITGRIAAKYWKENRKVQDVYFGQMSDMIYGFKELILNRFRRFSFKDDIEKYSKYSAELNKTASIKFLNFNIYNALMYNAVFGIVVFLFPLLSLDIDANDIRENLFIVFYMIGPFASLARDLPELLQMRVYLNRINELIEELNQGTTVSMEKNSGIIQSELSVKGELQIHLDEVVYQYTLKDEKTESEFILGPITATFQTGEIAFITGGNGSGKSTLSKLVTGLYQPKSGSIKVNGEEVDPKVINEYFSAIYSDYYLFKKLYGIDWITKEEEINYYLDLMKLTNKLEINENGEFNTINLSSGQKKRLAFIICCLEDKPMMLFDEWAAEQDPEFRHYFYTELLPILKKKGKGVIVITHDDRYFNTADKCIKLERGYKVNAVE